jgi:hypothetical protein
MGWGGGEVSCAAIATTRAQAGIPLPAHLAPLAPFMATPYGDTLANRDLDKALSGVGGDLYNQAVGPTVDLSQNIGNSYTAALWSNLVSTVDTLGAKADGKRLGLFSYGSGAIASMFTMDAVAAPTAAAANPKFSLDGMKAAVNLKVRRWRAVALAAAGDLHQFPPSLFRAGPPGRPQGRQRGGVHRGAGHAGARVRQVVLHARRQRGQCARGRLVPEGGGRQPHPRVRAQVKRAGCGGGGGGGGGCWLGEAG